MSAATGAGYLGAVPVRVGRPAYGTREVLVETGPAAARVELCCRTEEGLSALPAHIGTGCKVLVVLVGVRRFRAAAQYDGSFFRGKGFEDHGFTVAQQRPGRYPGFREVVKIIMVRFAAVA